MKRPFLIVHDYGTGAVMGRVIANKRSDIEALLPPPDWIVYDLDEPRCPEIPESFRIPESDIDSREPWLEKYIFIQQRQAEGKISIPVRGTNGDVLEYRHIWARSPEEVRKRFPTLEFLYGVVLTQKEMGTMGNSDIDTSDDFLERYEK